MSEGVLEGRVAIVTGASRGIGRAVAERFGAQGAKVAVNWVRGDREARDVVEGIKNHGGDALAGQGDDSRSAGVRKLVRATVDAFGRVDILVNNAGGMVPGSGMGTTEEDWDRTTRLN